MAVFERVPCTRYLAAILLLMLQLVLLETAALAVPAPQATPLPPLTAGLSSPIRIAVDQSGGVFVTDPRGGGILHFNGSGSLVGVIGTAGQPQGVAVTAAGNLAVTLGDHASVLDGSGKELFRLGAGSGQFKMANGVALDDNGLIYVVDSLDDCIQVFAATGVPVTMAAARPGKPANSFGSTGSAPGQFFAPTGISFEKNSRQLAVADTLNGRVQFFDATGTYQKSIGTLGSGPLQFTSPQATVFEYSKDAAPQLKRTYVVDSFQGNLQAIDPAGAGSFLGYIGSYGTGSGNLLNPSDAAFDSLSGHLYVVNVSARLAVFAVSDGAGGGTGTLSLTVNPVPTVTSSPVFTIGGSVTAGATVGVTTNTAALGGSAGVSGSNWSFTVSGLVPGANLITVRASDTAGTFTTATTTLNYLPAAPSFSVNPVQLTNQTSQTISGTMDAGALVTVTTVAGVQAGAVRYPTTTSWACDLSGLANGSNAVTVSAALSGGASASKPLTITLDLVKPALSVSALPDGSSTGLQTQNIQGSVVDANLDKVTVNGTVVAVINGSFSLPVVLMEGSNAINVTASDLAGNLTSDSRSVQLNPAATQLAISLPADNSVTGSALLALSGTAATASQVTLNGTQALLSGGTWNGSVQLLPGLNTVVVKAIDPAGIGSTLKRTVFLATAGPDLALSQPPQDLATNSTTLALAGTSHTATSVTVSVNGQSQPANLAGGIFNLDLTFPADGLYRVAVTAQDGAGISATTLRNVIVDTQAPQLTVNPIAFNQPSQLSGTVESDALLSAADKNGPAGLVSRGAGGSWLLELNTGYDLATLLLRATDAAGNFTSKSPLLVTSTPDGDLDGNGKVDVADAMRALRIAAGIIAPNAYDMAHGDVAPLANGKPAPDGAIDIADVLAILRKSVGLASW